MASSPMEDLATCFEQQKSCSKTSLPQQQQQQPTPLMIYQTGSILCNIHHQLSNTTNNSNNATKKEQCKSYKNLVQSYREMIKSLSPHYLQNVICKELNLAFCSVMENQDDNDEEEVMIISAMKSMCGIYTNSSLMCQIGFSEKVCLDVVSFYDDNLMKKKNDSNSQEKEEMKECIFRTLSCLLLHGLIYPQQRKDAEEDKGLSSIMEVIQSLTAGDTNYCIGDLIQWQQTKKNNDDDYDEIKTTTLQKAIKQVFSDPTDQREYLLLMLDSCPNSRSATAIQSQTASLSSNKKKTTNSKKQNKNYDAKETARSTLQLRINQIKDVIPNLGEGYIEIALAIYDHDVNRTLTSLVESQSNPNALHPRLRALDPMLPARKKDDDVDLEEEEEARRIQKAHMKEMEGQLEQESYLVEQTAVAMGGTTGAGAADEYNDDYDDQYDAHEQDGGEIGNTDGGMYDLDLDAVRAYNKATLEAEREASFWEENRNLNRQPGKGKGKVVKNKSGNDENDANGEDNNYNSDGSCERDEKKYRGPDKGKGGRVIGPDGKYLPFKKGGKKGKAQQQQGGGGGAGGGGGGKGGGGGTGQNQPKKKGKQGGGGGGGGGAKQQKSSTDGDNMTKIQKRRKNDNKSKIGNHHRKERALKKAGGPGGM